MRLKLGDQSGQVALVALSVTAVLTLLSTMLIQRSVLEQKLSRQSEETARALNKAEAGVEEILSRNLETLFGENYVIENTTADGVQFRAEKTNSIMGEELKIGRTRDIDVNHNSRFTIEWGSTEPGNGLLVTVLEFNESLGSSGVTRYLFRKPGDGAFSELSAVQKSIITVGSGGDVAIPNNAGSDIKVRIKALGDDKANPVAFSILEITDLPTQEYRVEAEAQLDSGVSTNVQASQTKPQLPDIFDYALFSGGDISK